MAATDSTILERPQPQNLDAERTVLGAILVDPMSLTRVVASGLRDEHFAREAHRKTFEVLVALSERGAAPDIVLLKNELIERGWLESAGGAGALSMLLDGVPDVANVEHWAAIVKDKWLLRKLILVGQTVAREAVSGGTGAKDVLETAEREIFALAEDRVRAGFSTIAQVTDRNLDAIQKMSTHKGLTGIATGFEKLDEMTSGLQRSDLVIVAARPSMGKTSLVMNIAEHMSIRENRIVAFFSLEMSADQLGFRVLCSESRIGGKLVRHGMLTQDQWRKLMETRGRLDRAPLFIDDMPGISVMEMRAKARRLKMQHGRLDCVVVDYLQLMTERGYENRNLEIAAISRGLKGIAKELDVPVIALSQLSRQPDRRGGDHRPQLSDLRESGAIEQDADVVLFIYRDEVYNKESEKKGRADIIIAKQRNGPIGDFELTFFSDYTRFENLDYASL